MTTQPAAPALEGTRIVDFSALLPGPIATQVLADFGATVIKVERPGGDPIRQMMPGVAETVSRGKGIVELDLKQRDDRARAHALIEGVDVVVEGGRPGMAARLGIDYDSVRDIAPHVVYCSLSGYGQTGPRRVEPGHDLNYLALTGALVAPGGQGMLSIPLLPIADTLSGAYAASAILAALAGGRGAYIDLSIAEAALAAMAPILAEHVARGSPPPRSFPARPAYGVYETSDRRRLCVACTEDHLWQRLCDVLGFAAWRDDVALSGWEGRARRAREIDAAIATAIRRAPLAQWMATFTAADLPVNEVAGFDAVLDEPQFNARGALLGAGAVGFPALVDGRRPQPLDDATPWAPRRRTRSGTS